MREWLETLRGFIIGVVIHRRERLNGSERAELVKQTLLANFPFPLRKTKHPVIIAMIGLIGSGKSHVARELAKHIGALVIEGDDIRIALRKRQLPYENTRAIAEDMALEVVRAGSNVILDSDFVDPNKRASLREKARKGKAKVLFLCTYTGEDSLGLDISVGRIVSASYQNSVEDFFGGAGTVWDGPDSEKGAVVKLRELMRRLPQHYKWQNVEGGRWAIRKPPCRVVGDIDTSDERKWPEAVCTLAATLISQY